MSKLEVTLPEVLDFHCEKSFDIICTVCVINHFYSVPKSRSMFLAKAQQAACLWQTQPTESSTRTVLGWQILNWKEQLTMEKVKNSHT